ncbi:MAG: Gfo/Idh/MocA family oxidoreductase, partial [Pirellulaceae bacterium]|nr:Gfo/Idh/MocA family oxidoreductase [Pirellulaceae bacterium]
MIRFAVVGTGWRSHFFLRTAAACPDCFDVTAVVSRTPEKKQEFHQLYGVKLVPTLDDAIATKPLFVLTSLPMTINPGVLHQLVDRTMPVLSERAPGKTLDDLTRLAARVKQGAKIQVTEQYFLQPHHAARLAFVHSRKFGRVSQAQISADGGLGLLRKYLGVSLENPTITATAVTSPLLKFNKRLEPEAGATLVNSNQTIAWLDYGDRFGVFDFDGEQYGSPIRNQRVLVRGER